jgi:hypothetical protein
MKDEFESKQGWGPEIGKRPRSLSRMWTAAVVVALYLTWIMVRKTYLHIDLKSLLTKSPEPVLVTVTIRSCAAMLN